ncbi:hypothetical protein NX059_002496 [Plenodomus lindquistii]|nr:hypothetical protein NX059_002496 [Plenodomus lindquistii]
MSGGDSMVEPYRNIHQAPTVYDSVTATVCRSVYQWSNIIMVSTSPSESSPLLWEQSISVFEAASGTTFAFMIVYCPLRTEMHQSEYTTINISTARLELWRASARTAFGSSGTPRADPQPQHHNYQRHMRHTFIPRSSLQHSCSQASPDPSSHDPEPILASRIDGI